MLKILATATAFFITFNVSALADDIEWKYFTNPGHVRSLEAGETGYKVCADPSWAKTAPDKDRVALVPTRQCNYPAIPSEDQMYSCLGSADVVAVNWTMAKAEEKTETVLAAAANIGQGLPEVVIPESASSPPDYVSPCLKKNPEEIAKIKADVLEGCSTNAFSNLWYDCSCMADSYEKIANEDDGKNLAIHDSYIHWHTSKQPAVCFNEEAVKKEKFSWCFGYLSQFDSENPNKEAICNCTAEEVAASFKADPNYNGRFLEKIVVESQTSCEKRMK